MPVISMIALAILMSHHYDLATVIPSEVICGNRATFKILLGKPSALSTEVVATSDDFTILPKHMTVEPGAIVVYFPIETLPVSERTTQTIEFRVPTIPWFSNPTRVKFDLVPASLRTIEAKWIDPTRLLIKAGLDGESFGGRIELRSSSSRLSLPGSIAVGHGERTAHSEVFIKEPPTELVTMTALYRGQSVACTVGKRWGLRGRALRMRQRFREIETRHH